ncbi:hypothetical protein BD309DRAFT_7651 [Dichomitus squalens]|nr:hypothetical protein BD309DRAFT_7651 [Dichomitus squalens]
MAPPVLSHLQSGSSRRVQAREEATVQYDQQAMPPPPPPGHWSSSTRAQIPAARLDNASRAPSRQPSFLPPPTPKASSSSNQRFIPTTPSRAASNAQPATPRMFLPGIQFGSQSHTQRFVPSGAQRPSVPGSGSGNMATSGSTSQAFRSPSLTTSRSGGQRAPFVPGASGGLS